MLGDAPTQVQHFAHWLVESPSIHMDPLLKPVQILLFGIPSFYCVSCSTQLGVICKFAESALSPTV